jgi:hypothetical protein
METHVKLAMKHWFKLAKEDGDNEFRFGADFGYSFDHSEWYQQLTEEFNVHPIWFDYRWQRYEGDDYEGVRNDVLLQRFKVSGKLAEVFNNVYGGKIKSVVDHMDLALEVGFSNEHNGESEIYHFGLTERNLRIVSTDMRFWSLETAKIEELIEETEAAVLFTWMKHSRED